MFSKSQVSEVIALFKSRKLHLYHACHLQDFYSYLTLSGICSREVLDRTGLPITTFDTDPSDKAKGLWNLVFGNFNDFSAPYHWENKTVPNPFGPILIKIDCDALAEAEDFSVTLRSAGAADFSRTAESLTSVTDLEKIFYNPIGHPKAYQVKFEAGLQKAFPSAKVKSLEWSMTFPDGILPIDYFVEIIVDQLIVGPHSLIDEVRRLAVGYHKLLGDIVVRSQSHSLYPNLVSAIGAGAKSLGDLHANPDLASWAAEVAKLDYQFKRYAQYTKEGTLNAFGRFTPPKAS